MQIFLDESGYTGEDLLNKEQPAFVLAALAADDARVDEWKTMYFAGVKAVELKHSALRSRPKQQEMVVRFLSDPEVNTRAKVAFTHKRFALAGKIVDYLYEPAFQEQGHDVYKRGQNIALANALYYLLDPLMGAGYFERLGRTFQNVMRQRSKEAFGEFDAVLMEASGHAAKLLAPVIAAVRKYGISCIDRLPKSRLLDVSIAAAFSVVDMWSKHSDETITIIHDESSNMAAQKDIWDALVAPDVPAALVGYDRRKTQFPLRVLKTDFRRSDATVGLQLADVLAGAVATVVEWRRVGSPVENQYAANLASAMDAVENHSVWPRQEFTAEALGTLGDDGPDPLDFGAGVLAAKRPLG